MTTGPHEGAAEIELSAPSTAPRTVRRCWSASAGVGDWRLTYGEEDLHRFRTELPGQPLEAGIHGAADLDPCRVGRPTR